MKYEIDENLNDEEFENIEIKSINELNLQEIQDLFRGKKKLNLNFNLSMYDNEIVRKLAAFTKELKTSGCDVNVTINAIDKHFTFSDMGQFIVLEEELNKSDISLHFDGGVDKGYSISEVISAQNKLNSLIEIIKMQKDLSPFEKYLIIYDFLTAKIYKENEENKARSRDIIGLMNGDDIVCVGYSQLMEYICNAVGIKCYVQQSRIYDENGEFLVNHENNLVYIDDDKYNIHGLYYSDACWDHVEKGMEDRRTYSFCLIPLSDKDKMNKQINITDDNMFFYPDKEYIYKLVDGEYYGSTFGRNADGDYSKMIKDLGLEERYNITEAMVDDLIADRYKRKYATTQLKNIFKKENVPADIYRDKSEVPFGCSFDFLLSLLMCEGAGRNYDLIKERIKLLKENYNSNKPLDYAEAARSYVTDVYVELDNMENINLEAYSANSDNEMNFSRWLVVKEKMTKTYMAGIVYNNLQRSGLCNYGEPIPEDAFRTALRKSYKVENVRPDEISKRIDTAMSDSRYVSENVFDDSASNCFSVNSVKASESGLQ